MLISVVNHTDGKLTDEAVQEGIRAVNRQIAEDYNPHWHMGAAAPSRRGHRQGPG